MAVKQKNPLNYCIDRTHLGSDLSMKLKGQSEDTIV